MNLGMGEIVLLIVLALVLFGPKRLPEMGSAAGKAIREFKSALNMADSNKTETETITITEKADKVDKNSAREDESDTK